MDERSRSDEERNHKVSRFHTNSRPHSPFSPNRRNDDDDVEIRPYPESKPFDRLTHLLRIVHGDATNPIDDGKKIIAHICNNAGGWGRGFVVALSKRWILPEQQYRKLPTPIDLGFVQFVTVTEDITVANMVAQTNPQHAGAGSPPIKYGALRTALKNVGNLALGKGASVHMPKIGTGLSRGNWEVISDIIKEELISLEIPVFVYVYGG